MINKIKNGRLDITLSKKQIAWLRKTAKQLKISVSQLIKKLIDRSLDNLIKKLPEDDLNELIRIAKTPWLSFPGDDEI